MQIKFLEIFFRQTKLYFEALRKTFNKICVLFQKYLTFVYLIKKVSCENIVRKKIVLRKTLLDPNVSLACTLKTAEHSPKSWNILPNCAACSLGECSGSTFVSGVEFCRVTFYRKIDLNRLKSDRLFPD